MDSFTIGELARQANVHVETLRYYERRGLIRSRTGLSPITGFILPRNLRRVKFIKQAQGLGFSLNQIKKLLALRATPRARCADVRRYATHKIEDIDARIHSLARMRKTLEKLLVECSGNGPATHCPILESLESEKPTINQAAKSKPKGGSHEY